MIIKEKKPSLDHTYSSQWVKTDRVKCTKPDSHYHNLLKPHWNKQPNYHRNKHVATNTFDEHWSFNKKDRCTGENATVSKSQEETENEHHKREQLEAKRKPIITQFRNIIHKSTETN